MGFSQYHDYLTDLLKRPEIGSRGIEALYEAVKDDGKPYLKKLKK